MLFLLPQHPGKFRLGFAALVFSCFLFSFSRAVTGHERLFVTVSLQSEVAELESISEAAEGQKNAEFIEDGQITDPSMKRFLNSPGQLSVAEQAEV